MSTLQCFGCFKHHLIQGYLVSQLDAVRTSQVDPFPWNYYLVLRIFGNKEVKYVGVSFGYSIKTFFAARFVNSAWNLPDHDNHMTRRLNRNTDRCFVNNTREKMN